MHYSVSAEGRLFIKKALSACENFSVSWEQLWASESTAATNARASIEFITGQGPADAKNVAMLFGTFAVVDCIYEAAADFSDEGFKRTAALLGKADLLNDLTIDAAASVFGLEKEDIWNLLALEP